MLKMLVRAALPVAITLGGAALAADSRGDFLIHGDGGHSCATLNDAYARGDSAGAGRILSWTEGYATGFNEFFEGTYDILARRSADDYVADVADTCRANPRLTVHAAASQVLRGYYERRRK